LQFNAHIVKQRFMVSHWRCSLILLLAGLVISGHVLALDGSDAELPQVVPVGKGSYATRPPRSKAARPDVAGKAGWGDATQVFINMKLWVTPGERPIPSTHWWTNLITQRWSGQLWAYPLMAKAVPQGMEIYFPKRWQANDKKTTLELVADSKLLVRGEGFKSQAAEADQWSDWLLKVRMAQSPEVALTATLGHGLPTVWFESKGVDLRVDADSAGFFELSGKNATLPLASGALGVEIGKDQYGLFAPAGTKFFLDGKSIAVKFADPKQTWLAVSVLPSRQDLALFAKYAAVIPRDTEVSWNYLPEQGKVDTTWTLTTENLAGGPEHDVIQGWLPHHYNPKPGTQLGFALNDLRYATPRGELRGSVGHEFKISWPFTGLLPDLPAPLPLAGKPNPYRAEVMKALIDNYTDVTGYGFETYWGGKKILLYAKYLSMAHQLGMTEAEKVFHQRLTEALTDWCTYTPGEPEHFFGMYPNWGSLIGFRTRDNQNPGIDFLQDHHFCYGYHVYAAALLGMYDPQFLQDYGGMATLMAKDYANWDTNDKRFCRFRNFDPWCGHSWSGGLGSEKGNGMESSSESMQSWGAMFVLGEMLSDKQMRDAGAFGYAMESRGVAEYWFDRNRSNIPYDIWPHEYNSNIGTEGIGWWTWFSGNNYWMHAIQWLPMSPLLKYLYEDPAFAKFDYETMWKTKEAKMGGWDSTLGKEAGVGNVTLSYLNIFDPDQAAQIFDDLWDKNMGTAHAKDESGPTYYRIHAGRGLGHMRFDAWTSLPLSSVFERDGKNVAVVYNAANDEQDAKVYVQGKEVGSFKVPPRKLMVFNMDGSMVSAGVGNIAYPAAPANDQSISALTIEPQRVVMGEWQTQKFVAKKDGKEVQVTWSVQGKGTVSADGVFTPSGGCDHETSAFQIIANANGEQAVAYAAVEEARRVRKITVTPGPTLTIAEGGTLSLAAEAEDQFKARYELPIQWQADGSVSVDANGQVKALKLGDGKIRVSAGGVRQELAVSVLPVDQMNLALGKPASASSEVAGNSANDAVDGNMKSRWESEHADPQWFMVDLQKSYRLNKVIINWENARASAYNIELSEDGSRWQSAYSTDNAKGKRDEIAISGVSARYVRLNCLRRGTGYGNSIFEFEVYGK
jgi:endoglucanase Acf2